MNSITLIYNLEERVCSTIFRRIKQNKKCNTNILVALHYKY